MKKIALLIFLLLSFVYPKTEVIHVLVSLCDNKYQSIFPVPRALGNGQEAKNNLYWGAMYGVKTYFNKQNNWVLQKKESTSKIILETLIYKHKNRDIYLIAQAYNGKHMKETLFDFFSFVSFENKKNFKVGDREIKGGGDADLIIFVGHNGLMDYSVKNIFTPKKLLHEKSKNVAVFACQSQKYFSSTLFGLNANPLILTTGNMAPEAYVVHSLIDSYINNSTKETTRKNVATTYSKFQKLKNPALKLFTYELK